jgi:hypothetical protein
MQALFYMRFGAERRIYEYRKFDREADERPGSEGNR